MLARGQSLCRKVLVVLLAIYLLTLAYAGIGSQGLFGLELDRRAMIALFVMGVPWSVAPAFLPEDSVPLSIIQLAIIGAPAFNLFVLHLLCPSRKRRRASTR
ncbi:MAG: hypothetical protein AAFY31_03080 [Pseudomonadota bacterium]